MRVAILIGAALVIGCATAPAQTPLADRIRGVRNGTVRLSYAVKEGICGDGESFIRDRSRGENNFMSFDEGNSRYYGRGWRERPCEPGPARVAISKSDGSIAQIRVYVGGAWGSATGETVDLGEVAAPAAAKALLAVAARDGRADRAIFAAVIADSAVVWPDLLAIAKNDELYKSVRNSAVFWLSQVVSDEATKGLADLAEDQSGDRGVRDQAVFALSQLPHDQGVPILIRLARSNQDPQVRRKAIFWLGQSDDPRAIKLFEEILTGKR